MKTLIRCYVVLAVPAFTSTTWAQSERTVSNVQVQSGSWRHVSTMLDGHVESILSLRTSEPVGDNLTAVWNRRTEDGSWSSASWTSQDQSRIISEVKYELSLPETTDASWPIQPAIPSLRATEMAAFEHGLLVSDPFANLVANGTELAAILLEALEDSGWQAANLAPIFEPDEPLCDSMVVLDYAASLVESETELFAPTVVLRPIPTVRVVIPTFQCLETR